jgi:transcription factor YY
VGRRPNGRSAH